MWSNLCSAAYPTERIEGDVLVTRHADTGTLWVLTADNQISMRVRDPRIGRTRWYTEELDGEYSEP